MGIDRAEKRPAYKKIGSKYKNQDVDFFRSGSFLAHFWLILWLGVLRTLNLSPLPLGRSGISLQPPKKNLMVAIKMYFVLAAISYAPQCTSLHFVAHLKLPVLG